jgi:antitoxin (DNA-binding transcriptional repressor) of toxin-antitoxin stability system
MSTSLLLARVRRGARYRIFDRDTPVADLVPVDAWRADTPAEDDIARRRRLIAHGLIRPGDAGGAPRELLRPGPRLIGGSAVAALLDERKTGR